MIEFQSLSILGFLISEEAAYEGKIVYGRLKQQNSLKINFSSKRKD
jgi:hypothetical protein